jgi:hypothetical protein
MRIGCCETDLGARRPIKHPRRNLQPTVRIGINNIASKHHSIRLIDRLMKRDRKTRPRMKAVKSTSRNSVRWAFGGIVTRRLRAMGIRDKPTAPVSPWQNGFAERLIGSIRRERLDHIVVFGEAHLRRILRCYARYYNDVRTDRSLYKDAPVSRPVQRTGSIKSFPILGGLHHHYARA